MTPPAANPFSPACPVPLRDYPHILLAHGGGGRLMRDLIDHLFAAAFANPFLDRRHDAAVLPAPGGAFAFTTDSYVVRPLFFPGGDLGSLAVHGTVNDLAMAGARPEYLSASFILEEGLPVETLRRIVGSMAAAARAAGVQIVTGDTKVVDRGKGDGVFITTAGVGRVVRRPGAEPPRPTGGTTMQGGPNRSIEPAAIQPGDAILVSGDLGRHGMAIMAVREGLAFETTIESDSAPVHEPVLALLAAGVEVHCLRDLTRGGLNAALNEIAAATKLPLEVRETAIPVAGEVRAACEILGLDPLQVACEGRFVVFLPAAQAARALAILRAWPVAAGAAAIGDVGAGSAAGPGGEVVLASALGVRRVLDLPVGEQLPRIC